MTAPAVELTGLTKRFASLTAVDGVDLTIAPGEVVALLGPNGAGKTTTTEMILGLTRPDAGSVRVFGQPPAAATANGTVSAMLQNGALLEDSRVSTVLDMLHAVQAHPLPVAEAVRRAEIGDLLKANTNKLSGGQAQRLRYAMAIMADPDLILLDEPTVALDVEGRRRFWDGMREFAASGRTVVFATHYLEEADEFADRVVVMRAGRVVADGTGAEIKRTAIGRVVSFTPDAAPVSDVGVSDVGVSDVGASGAGALGQGDSPQDPSSLDWSSLPGVAAVQQVGPRIELTCSDSDAALRALLSSSASVHDIEVSAPTLEDAFVRLTA